MLDYYKILGISRTADHATIRSAYKKLALQYHPDLNPNNTAAEEYFKVINEAKQLLCNPKKKEQYDLILNYIYENSQRQVATQNALYTRYTPTTYARPGGNYWSNTPQYRTGSIYKIDKDYYRVQLLTLMVVALISIFSISIFRINSYLDEKKKQEKRIENEKILTEAQALYDNGNYRKALDMVIGVIRKNPIEKEYFNRKERMVAGLNSKAVSLYQRADYKKAVENLQILREYQTPMRLSTWNMIADCNYKLGNYKKAIHALEYILIRDKNNIDLIIRIGDIYYDNLHLIDKALEYYDDAKKLFKEFQTDTYGEAFELVMPVEKTPQVYYYMFSRRAEINMAGGNYKEAIKDYNWAAYLRPEKPHSYYFRAICRQKAGDNNRACNDWRRAVKLGASESKQFITRYCR